MNFFACLRHACVLPNDAYRAHADAAHDGSAPCVLGLGEPAERAHVAGATFAEVVRIATTRTCAECGSHEPLHRCPVTDYARD